MKAFLKRWRTRLIVVAVLVAAGVAWRLSHQPPPPPPPPSGVVTLADITQSVQAAGVLQAKTKVDVGAQVSGQIQTLHVQLGQQVKKGELLVSLDPARDDPAALRRVAEKRRLDPARWTLARTGAAGVRRTAAVLGIRYRALADGEFNHSSALVLLDGEGRVLARTEQLGAKADPVFVAAVRSALAGGGG